MTSASIPTPWLCVAAGQLGDNIDLLWSHGHIWSMASLKYGHIWTMSSATTLAPLSRAAAGWRTPWLQLDGPVA